MGSVSSRDGTRIAFDRIGAGPPVIMVDGGPAHRAINPAAAQVASLLSPHFSAYTYDRRGRGDSGDNSATPVVEREIEDLDALIAEAGGTAFVFGGSSGGLLGLDAAAHGLAISKLALYEVPLIVDDSLPPLREDYPARLHDLIAADRRNDAAELFSTEVMRMPAEVVAQMRSGPFWGELEKVAPALGYEAALYGDALSGKPLTSERWGSIKIPTLVIDGEAGLTMMHTGADALASVLPNARRRTLTGQAHDVAPEVLAPVLAEFFQNEG